MDARLYEDFARLEDNHWWFTGRRSVVREVLRRRLPNGRSLRILDVGCGTGGMLAMLREFGDVEGMDASDQALSHARRRVGEGVPLYRGQLPDGIPAGRTYDVITAFDVIEHIPDAVGALSAVKRALAQDGTLVCTVPAYQFLWSKHDELNQHQRRYTAALLERHLRAAGFSVFWQSYFNSFLFPPIAAVRLARKIVPERDGGTDLGEAPGPINRLLDAVFSAERFVLSRARFPFGVSLLALARPVH